MYVRRRFRTCDVSVEYTWRIFDCPFVSTVYLRRMFSIYCVSATYVLLRWYACFVAVTYVWRTRSIYVVLRVSTRFFCSVNLIKLIYKYPLLVLIKSRCFLCCSEYDWNVLHSISDFYNVLTTPINVNYKHAINKQAKDNTLGETGVK